MALPARQPRPARSPAVVGTRTNALEPIRRRAARVERETGAGHVVGGRMRSGARMHGRVRALLPASDELALAVTGAHDRDGGRVGVARAAYRSVVMAACARGGDRIGWVQRPPRRVGRPVPVLG